MPDAQLTLYNTLTRRKEPFAPIDPARVRMYVCGPTVYDFAHIGNARPVLVFDVLFRLLRHLYGAKHVSYVRNVTDVDDKINARAVERFPDMTPTDAIRALTESTLQQFHADLAGLGTLPPTVEPRATEHIPEMRALCDALIVKGHAYVAEEHVLFDVSSMPDYGRLANRSLDEMEAGARVDVAPYKRGPMDFVLWKPSKPTEPGWPSPAGIVTDGRPGWHLECSAMAGKHLGETFDIHGGGIDLVFPHHENELAQSRCAHGTPVMANVWMHNGFLQVEGDKMSKSLGNFITIAELLKEWPGEALRLNMLRTQYRQPTDWTASGLEEAVKTLDRWYEFAGDGDTNVAPEPAVFDALCDDLNTPKAIAELHGLINPPAAGTSVTRTKDEARALLKASAKPLGLLRMTASEWKAVRTAGVTVDVAKVEAMIAARLQARRERNFAESDRIRDEIGAMGLTLKDTKDPATGEIVTTWEIKL
jgi:cysteinyl-tRNA synthetase